MTVSFVSPLFHGQGPNTARGLRVANRRTMAAKTCKSQIDERPAGLTERCFGRQRHHVMNQSMNSWNWFFQAQSWVHLNQSHLALFSGRAQIGTVLPISCQASPAAEALSGGYTSRRPHAQREESLSVREIFMAWVPFFSTSKVSWVFQPFLPPLWALTELIGWYLWCMLLTTGRLLWHHCESNCSDCSSSTSGTGRVPPAKGVISPGCWRVVAVTISTFVWHQVLLGGDTPIDPSATSRLPGLQWHQPPALPGLFNASYCECVWVD